MLPSEVGMNFSSALINRMNCLLVASLRMSKQVSQLAFRHLIHYKLFECRRRKSTLTIDPDDLLKAVKVEKLNVSNCV